MDVEEEEVMNDPEEHPDRSPLECEPPDKVDKVDAPSWRVTEEESGWKPLLPERKLGIWWALLTVVVAVWCGAMAVLINVVSGVAMVLFEITTRNDAKARKRKNGIAIKYLKSIKHRTMLLKPNP